MRACAPPQHPGARSNVGRSAILPRRLLILLVLAATCAVPGPSAQAAIPPDFVGIESEDVFVRDAAYRDRTMGRQAQVGIGLIRRTFNWAEIEYERGLYDFTRYDTYVAAAARRRIRILPILYNPPEFWSSRPATRARPGTYPPSDMGAFGRLGAEVARRYGRGGSFWRENPDVRNLPILSYQIWNEPNLPTYWPTGPNAWQYAAMLRAVGKAIKAVDRRAEIVTAGVPDSKSGIKILPFYEALYRAGGRSLFDTLAINPYAPSAGSLANKLRDVRRLMLRRGDREGRIWVTEMGWADRAPGLARHPLIVGPRQGLRIAQAIRTIGQLRLALRIRGFVYYGWRDTAPYGPLFTDFWGLHTGLHRRIGTPKPSLRSFQEAVKQLKARARGRAR